MGLSTKGKLTNMVTYTSGKVFNECVGPIWSHVQFVGFEHKFNSGEGKELGVHANGQWWSRNGTSYVQFAPNYAPAPDHRGGARLQEGHVNDFSSRNTGKSFASVVPCKKPSLCWPRPCGPRAHLRVKHASQ